MTVDSKSGTDQARVCFIVGASGAIGRAIVLEMAATGHRIGGTYRSRKRELEAFIDRLDQGAARHCVAECDTSDRQSVARAYAALEGNLGTPNSLIYCAGIRRDRPLVHMDPEDWDAVLDTNLRGAFDFVRLVLPSMIRARYGRIVLISSVSGSFGVDGQSNYGASKAGMEALARSVAREVGPFRIAINAIAPGLVESEMTDGLSAASTRGFLNRIPLRRFAKASEISPLAGFLASDRASYITGQTFTIDGGLSA